MEDIVSCRIEDQEDIIRRGPWTAEEDMSLIRCISVRGEGRWNTVAKCAGLKRTGKSCRLRWLNYLSPDVKRGNITREEQLLILELHGRWGNRWSKIARHLPGRTDNEIKNYWRTRMKKSQAQYKAIGIRSNPSQMPSVRANTLEFQQPRAQNGAASLSSTNESSDGEQWTSPFAGITDNELMVSAVAAPLPPPPCTATISSELEVDAWSSNATIFDGENDWPYMNFNGLWRTDEMSSDTFW